MRFGDQLVLTTAFAFFLFRSSVAEMDDGTKGKELAELDSKIILHFSC